MRHETFSQWLAACFLSSACFLITAAPASAAWPTNPTVNVPVTAAPSRAANPPDVAPDSCGGIIVAWSDVGTGISQINVQRTDVFGQPRWALDGLPISPPLTAQAFVAVASDGAGGAYVAWSTVVTAATGSDVFVQHVLSTGLVDPAWAAGGLPVCSLPGNQEYPRIVTDGNFPVIAWSDSRANPELAPDIYAQRVSPTGAMMWTADGTPVVTEPGGQYLDDIAADGSGGIWAVWDDLTGNMAVQRLDRQTGAHQFAAAGKPICTGTLFARQVAIASESGRLFLTWSDNRSGPTRDIYAQELTGGGTVLWAANGAPVCLAPNNQVHPDIVPDGLGGAIVGWEDSDSGIFYGDRLVVQRLGHSGSPLWAPNGLPMCVSELDRVKVLSDQRNGAIFTWHDFRNGSALGASNADVFAQRVSDTGLMLWTPNGVAVSTAPGNQVGALSVPDGAGGAVIAWTDARGVDGDIYAQQVGATGALGVRAASKNCAPDLCGFAYTDFGDAPENAPVYPSGSFGHFPTCTADTPPGTQEIACGAAPGTPPGPTGYVKHVATASDQAYFGLGCGPPNAQRLAVDTEVDGVVHVSGGPPAVIPSEVSTCSPGVTIMAYESAFGGLWFGTDETAGDGVDAGLAAPFVLGTCAPTSVPFHAWSCGPASVTVTLNILVDWNQDGDWNDVVMCGPSGSGGACTPEWAVKNASVVLQPGCNSLSSPQFTAGPNTGGAWMRVTLTAAPVSDDFPWAGSATAITPGGFAGGETEDYPVSVVTTTAVGQPAPADQVLLAAVSPNPTRDGASVRYALPRAADIRLAVYDLAGRKVRVLESGLQGAGEHAARWDGRDASGAETPAGLYLVKLHVEGRDLTRAMIRLR